MARIDEVNLQILRLLQSNGRMSLAELAVTVGRSESTVRERVNSLELDGFLMGYQAATWGDSRNLRPSSTACRTSPAPCS
jgi:DNA-binding Lrp family transcriptional regulator